jgi:thiol:disulfide interchange protein
VAPILTFVQMILPALGRWGGALRPVNAFLILGMSGWLFYTLRKEASEVATASVTAPSG